MSHYRAHTLDGHRLVFYTHSIGPSVEKYFGQDDIESWLTLTIPDLPDFARRLAERVGGRVEGPASTEIPRLVGQALRDGVFVTGSQVAEWAEAEAGCSSDYVVR